MMRGYAGKRHAFQPEASDMRKIQLMGFQGLRFRVPWFRTKNNDYDDN